MAEKVPKPRKGGITKQMRKANAAKSTRAGLSPELYAALQSIAPVDTTVLSLTERRALESEVQRLIHALREAQQAVVYQEQLVDRVRNDPIMYSRALFVLEAVSKEKAKISKALSAAEQRISNDNDALSVRLAYDLQTREVEEHRIVFGRLDWPGNPNVGGPAPPRVLRERSANVPSPKKWWQPDTSRPQARAPRRAPSPPLAPRSPRPVSPSLLDQALIQTPLVQYRKCHHRRLHRLFSPADLSSMKLLLKKSCSQLCGGSDDKTLTLAPPKRKKPVAMTFGDDPPSPIARVSPNRQSAQSNQNPSNEVSTKKVNATQNDDLPTITIDSEEEVVAEGDELWPVQIDGLNVQQILDLSTEPEDGGKSDAEVNPETETGNSIPGSTVPGTPASPNWVITRSPYRGPTPDLDTPPLKTPPDMWGNPGCKCPNNIRLGYCFCPEEMSFNTNLVSLGCTDFTDSQMANALADTDAENESDASAFEPDVNNFEE